jgi:hypothetical protein
LKVELIGDLDLNVSWVWDRVEDPRSRQDGTFPKQDDTSCRPASCCTVTTMGAAWPARHPTAPRRGRPRRRAAAPVTQDARDVAKLKVLTSFHR